MRIDLFEGYPTNKMNRLTYQHNEPKNSMSFMPFMIFMVDAFCFFKPEETSCRSKTDSLHDLSASSAIFYRWSRGYSSGGSVIDGRPPGRGVDQGRFPRGAGRRGSTPDSLGYDAGLGGKCRRAADGNNRLRSKVRFCSLREDC